MDIKDFFPSIREEDVLNFFGLMGYNDKVSLALSYLCCKDGCLPQGALTSPMLSNTMFYGMDVKLAELALQEDLSYTRYADDLTFSGQHIPIVITRTIEAVAAQNRLWVNREKTRRSGPKSRKIITGVSISSGKPTIPRERKRSIRQCAHYILTYGLHDHLYHTGSRDLLAGYCLLGELAYWHSIEPENQFVSETSSRLGEMLKRKD